MMVKRAKGVSESLVENGVHVLELFREELNDFGDEGDEFLAIKFCEETEELDLFLFLVGFHLVVDVGDVSDENTHAL